MRHVTLTVSIGMIALISGCTETPPTHVSNWHYYWKDGKVVDDIEHTEWVWGSKAMDIRGLSAPSKIQDRVGLADKVIDLRTQSIWVTNKNNPLISVQVAVPGSEGIGSVAITVSHEFKHVWVYTQWGAEIKQTGMINGRQHTDGDAIPDDVEKDRSAGSIGEKYEFLFDDPDTFNLGNQSSWAQYKYYGDSEILAREEGFNNPRATHPDKDWSMGGKNWGR